jgi:diguanylate cyclase (GGDEF)-like protein/PAS domain S-box-containing protein
MENNLSQSVYSTTFEQMGIGMALVSPKGRFIRVNTSLCRFLGYTEEELLAIDFQQITPEEYLQIDFELVYELLDGIRDTYQLEKQYIHKSGKLIWGQLTVTLVRNKVDEPEFFVAVVEDIDEKKRIEQQLYDSQEIFRQIISSLSDRMLVWVAKSDFSAMQYVNDGYQQIWGRAAREMFADPLCFIRHVHVADRQRVMQHYMGDLCEDWVMEYRVIRDDGELRYIRDHGVIVRNVSGKIINLVGTADDITSDKQLNAALVEANAKLNEFSRIDGLTGISNRNTMLEDITTEINFLKRGKRLTSSCLLFLDLDDFKIINDKYGHAVGDLAIKGFVSFIQKIMRQTDKFGRYGGDEFLLLLCDTNGEESASFLERLKDIPITTDANIALNVHYSVGVASWEPNIESAQQWIELADASMYQQKKHKNNHECDTRN